jgi:hypothetical protein
VSDIGDDGQGGAEVLDEAELGGDDAYVDEPLLDYPPDRPLGVAEPQVADDGITDSVARRAEREQPEVDGADRDPGADRESGDEDEEPPVLVEDDDGDELTAEAVEPATDDLAPEEAALHVEHEDEAGRP